MMKWSVGLLAVGLLAACQLAPAAPGGPLPNQTVLPSTPLRYPTLPPEWTATFTPTAGPPTATPAPSRTPSATPVGPYSQRLAARQIGQHIGILCRYLRRKIFAISGRVGTGKTVRQGQTLTLAVRAQQLCRAIIFPTLG